MRKEGTIVRWDHAKGFGFIRSGDVAQDVFVRVRDYRSKVDEAPRQGLRVSFEDVHIGGKGPRVMAVQPTAESGASTRAPQGAQRPAPLRHQGARRLSPAPRSGGWWALPLMAAYGLAMTWLGFRTTYWATVAIHCAGASGIWWFSRTL